MMSRQSYATGNAERLAARARSFVRNEVKNRQTISQATFDELAHMIVAIGADWRVPRRVRDELKESIWAEFKINRPLAVLVSSVDAGGRSKRLRGGAF